MKKILIILLCFTLALGGIGCNKTDPRETEIVQLVVKRKYDEAIARTKELYEGKEMEEMLAWVEEKKDSDKLLYGNPTSITKLEIQPDHTYRASGGYGYITGRVKNVTDTEISYFEVVVDLKDDKGNILHSEYTNDGLALKPNAMREFEIMFKHSDEYKQYNLSVGKVR